MMGYGSIEDLALNWGYYSPNVQGMLDNYGGADALAANLGYYMGDVDGLLTNNGMSSMEQFAQSQGFSAYSDWCSNIFGYDVNPTNLALEWGYTSPDVQGMLDYYGGTEESLAASIGYSSVQHMLDNNGTLENLAIILEFTMGDPQALYSAYGVSNAEEFAQNQGYSAYHQLATTYCGGDPGEASVAALFGYTKGDTQTLLDYYGSLENVANSQGFTNPDVAAFTAACGSAQMAALNYGYYTPTANVPSSPEEKISLIAAIQNGSIQSSDVATLVGNPNQNNGAIAQSNDPTFINEVIAALNTANKSSYANDVLTSAIQGSASSDTLPNLDFSSWDPTGQNISCYNTRLADTNISLDQLTQANQIYGIDLSGIDLTGFETDNLTGCNFSNTNVTGAQISNQGKNFNGGKTYLSGDNLAGTNLAGLDVTGGSITNISFSQVSGITGANLKNATTFRNNQLGTLDMTGFSTAANANLDGTNFSQVTNLNASSLNNAGQYQYASFSGQNMTGFNANNGKYLYGANFENATGLTAAALANAGGLNTVNLKGTGISKAQMTAALQALGKQTTSGLTNVNTMQFSN